jgi:peptide/nickel transport system permease protein
MARIIVRRLLGGLLLIILLTFSAFAVANAIPQNKACMFVDCSVATHTEMQQALHQHGFDQPIWIQYAHFFWRIVRHQSFGRSWNGVALDSTIGSALPVTASLVLGGMTLTLLLALPLGGIAALRPRSLADRSLLATSVIGLAVHPFVLGIGLATLFHSLGAPRGAYCPLTSSGIPAAAIFPGAPVPLNGQLPRSCGGVADWAGHMAVPWLVFALLFVPLYLRMIRTRLIATLGERYITTARAKGAGERRVVISHALRNAIGPILPMIALDAGTAIMAAIYIETIFGLPGVGYLAVQGLSGDYFTIHYDLPFIVAIVCTIGLFVVTLSTLADIANAWLDPRTRERATS